MSERLFFKAVKDGDLEAVKSLMDGDPALVHARDANKSTPLHWAAWKGHAPIVEALVAAGADLHAHSENDHWGTTPLHAAAHGNQRAAAAALIRLGADVNAVKPSGSGTPLAETRAHNAAAVAKLLIEAGAYE